jgi:hypothetical protein
MPRKAGESSSSSSGVGGAFSAIKEELGIGQEKRVGSGYEVESVCLYCLSMLQGMSAEYMSKYEAHIGIVTAAPAAILRSLPIKRLKDYIAAYDIPCLSPSEKEDFVQAVIKARSLSTGCLSPEAEVSFSCYDCGNKLINDRATIGESLYLNLVKYRKRPLRMVFLLVQLVQLKQDRLLHKHAFPVQHRSIDHRHLLLDPLKLVRQHKLDHHNIIHLLLILISHTHHIDLKQYQSPHRLGHK